MLKSLLKTLKQEILQKTCQLHQLKLEWIISYLRVTFCRFTMLRIDG
ncbi:hypothetical protein X975_05310, partial [Stegodyphus mimosarum]